MHGESDLKGLSPVVVQSWLARIGADDPLGANPTRYLRRSGPEGIANYIPALKISADDPEGFDEIAFWRPLAGMLVYALIRTPSTMSRTPEIIAQYPSPYVVVGTQSMPGGGTFTQGGRNYHYRAPQHIVIFDNDDPYEQTSDEVADLAGVWVPVDVLGGEFVDVPLAPVITATPLASAAAAFVRNFAFDVAARGADVDSDTELAVIDLIRSILIQPQSKQVNDRVHTDPVYVREATQALIDHHFRDPEFSAETIAKTLHMSRRHLYRYFSDTGDTPATMIANRRLERARELLTYRHGASLDSIAAACGFASAATLRNRFRAAYMLTPTEFRRQSADAQAGAAGTTASRSRESTADS